MPRRPRVDRQDCCGVPGSDKKNDAKKNAKKTYGERHWRKSRGTRLTSMGFYVSRASAFLATGLDTCKRYATR